MRVLRRYSSLFLYVLLSGLMCISSQAQDETVPKADIFAGYQWLSPGGKVPMLGTSNPVRGLDLPDMSRGFGLGVGYNFHPNVAFEGDYGGDWKEGYGFNTFSFGPRFTARTENMNYFIHTLVGLNRLSTPFVATKNGVGAILGGGMDLKITKSFSIRLIEADYQWTHQNFAEFVPAEQPELRRPNYSGVRLRTGIVLNFGAGQAPVPPKVTVSAQPAEVMVGEPVTLTANATDFNPKHTVKYEWTTTGGKLSANDNTASVDTNGLAGGTYTATVRAVDPKAKKNNEASASTKFTVKEPPKNPPTMSCSANPASLQAGGTVTVTCECKSPDNQQITVSGWTASAGNISGTGNTGTLNTAGAAPGAITISATCTDARGLTGTAQTQVTIENPPPPPPQASKLSECNFPNKVKPWRVDNTCKAVLDDVAQALKNQPDAKLVAVGNADEQESRKRKNLAAERAVNAKAYLSGGEAKLGIDPSRIETRTGSAGTQTAEFWIIPPGANFTEPNTKPVDENQVKPVPDHPRAAAGRKPKKAQ